MRGWLLGVLLCCFCLPSVQAEEIVPSEVRLVSEVWEGHTNEDGTGLAWDLMRLIFEPIGVRLRIQSEPYTRSIGLVLRGEADAWVGSYRDEVEEAFYPQWHYDADQIAALGLADKPLPNLANLGSFRLVWMRGYEYQQYLPNLTNYREIHRRSGILAMLAYGHADFFIDARTEVEDILSKADDPSQYQVTDLTRLPVYLGFTNSPRGQALAALYDRRLAELVKSGSLRPIFRRWQQPYPF